MNSGSRISPRSLAVLPLFAIFVFSSVILVFAQKQTPPDKTAASHAKTAPAKTAPADDNDYSRKIKEYTTEKFFSTELVDHLPRPAPGPSPDKGLVYALATQT